MDHQPLEKLGKVHTKMLNQLQEIMNTYDFDIIYKKGSEMPAIISLETSSQQFFGTP